ncbi:hypothetical protein [uncultured Desulfovibrio sp.]|uniref:hypothetical protein n=1 Tax=uncultured Desulfovibrio sp. TaxID=167968 RepID=UPI002805DCDD|nr:hypothetical protein [uncultured Desulfovibrio sp.]
MPEQPIFFPRETTLEVPASEAPQLGADDYERATGEKLGRTLDLNTWHVGVDINATYERMEQEIAEATRQEAHYQKAIREQIFGKLKTRKGAPTEAGVYRTSPDALKRVHDLILFNGGTEACDGTVVSHDTIPVTITQIGVCLVSYQGNQGSWGHRIFRRDLRSTSLQDPIQEVLDVLDKRAKRESVDSPKGDALTSMARRAIMAFAERSVLLKKSSAVWRLGHGSPTPYELLTGSGIEPLVAPSLELMRKLISHKKFVFIPSSTKQRHWLTIGQALEPLEYAILTDLEDDLKKIAAGHYRGAWESHVENIKDFISEFGTQVLMGLYRSSSYAPAQVFYAHKDYVHEAVHIALADSVLQDYRGFPLLLDIADNTCSVTFGADVFLASTQLAYALAGTPFRYQSERSTRA